MPPNAKDLDPVVEDDSSELLAPHAAPRVYQVVYRNVLVYGYWHVAGLYGLYLFFGAKWQTMLFTPALYFISILGVTAGAHRLWAHKTYKASKPLQVFLMLCQSMACQNSVFYWARDHRMHHKHTDTDADPHNSVRGMFYSHCGWVLVKKHPDVAKQGKNVDMSDIYSNPVLQFQQRYIRELTFLLGIVLPTAIPMLCWGETFNHAWHLCHLRIITNLNATFLVNSLNHISGSKPYDKNITATYNKPLAILVLGEGFHNYHHVFPWDYRTSELGNTFANFTTMFIDFCGKMGWAWDLRSVPEDTVAKRMARTGDGTDLWGAQEVPAPN